MLAPTSHRCPGCGITSIALVGAQPLCGECSRGTRLAPCPVCRDVRVLVPAGEQPDPCSACGQRVGAVFAALEQLRAALAALDTMAAASSGK